LRKKTLEKGEEHYLGQPDRGNSQRKGFNKTLAKSFLGRRLGGKMGSIKTFGHVGRGWGKKELTRATALFGNTDHRRREKKYAKDRMPKNSTLGNGAKTLKESSEGLSNPVLG